MTGRWAFLANRQDIIQWADRVDAFPALPRLVRLLIDQTNDQVVELEMRADEGVRLQGYDGFSRSLRATPFVPDGAAVWEMGTDRDPKGKADDDYEKRTNPRRLGMTSAHGAGSGKEISPAVGLAFGYAVRLVTAHGR